MTTTTQFTQKLNAAGQPEFVGTWHKDFNLAYNGYRVRTVGGAMQMWCMADAAGARFGMSYETMAEVVAKIDEYAAADAARDSSPWYVGADWNSDELFGDPGSERTEDGGLVFHNSEGPGSAYRKAKQVYDLLCRERGAVGCCYYGRVDNYGTPEQEEASAEDITERDPAEEAADEQARYEEYLEDNREALMWEERWEAQKREY